MIYRNHDDYPEYPGFPADAEEEVELALEPRPEKPLDFDPASREYVGHLRFAERQWRKKPR
jgi:hypothetical protein